jgi:two-component system, chemotaxis family, sensor kinase CheA
MTVSGHARSPIRRLRALILLALVAGIGVYTGVTLALVQKLSERFGPQVEADLEWRAMRGAQELANTADVGLAVSDAAIVHESFGAYASSADVQAIIAVDTSGKVVAQHGELASAAMVFAAQPKTLVVGPGYLASWAPSIIEGNVVGKVAVAVSTARMTDADSLLHGVSRATMIAGVVALVLGTLVTLFMTHALAIRDHKLQDYAHNLERKVDERTRELDERTRGMRLVLDNVAQGFITIDLNGVMATERSAIVERWFGPSKAGTTFGQLVSASAPDFAIWFGLSLEALRDDFLPLEVCLDQLPRRFVAGERTFDVAYSPITADGALSSLLLIVSDVTAAIQRERTEREQREIVELFQRITADRAGFDEFFVDATRLVDQLRAPMDVVTERRTIHTLKGNCGIFGIRSYAELCHEIEIEIGDGALADEQRARLIVVWGEVTERLAKLRGDRKQDVIEIDKAELASLIDRAHAGASGRDLGEALAALAREPITTRFERLGRMATELARRLGKPEIQITIADGDVRLDADQWATFWSAMVHVVRNAIDHGIETADERVAANKPATCALEFSAVRSAGHLAMVVHDDGRGIDWDTVRAKALARGLRIDGANDLVDALFYDGLSTRDSTTELSGRGVGLGALRAAVERLGGVIAVHSEPGQGTTFEFSFSEAELGECQPSTSDLRQSA